ncbi:MAG: RIP metalloprotease RseP [Geoalkalibacter sp.]|jgi:regulator of sigma E protease|uniref:RIP metalloprotease RseP n=1 Tax=Geoalkalibacter sp. TaxID=3041440 RepID=UPI002A9AB214|nr:RIP metalloprotease RseP [Thermodesulfobacteriota bacterium]
MITIAAGIIMLGILVFIHEFGHFCVAKMSGVKVLKFSLGFGPRLFSKTWGETEYMICAVPLGGYVQMLGEGGDENGETDELTEEEKARSYAAKSPGQRMAIIAAGPLMNLVLPFVILPLAFMIGVNLPAFLDREPCIGFVAPESVAANAGFASGDCIEAVNGISVSSWNEANKKLISLAGSGLRFEVLRSGEKVELTIPVEESNLEFQSLGLFPDQPARIGGLAPNMPAAQAGMEKNDLIISIGEHEISSWYDLKNAIQKTRGQPVPVVVERNGERLEFTVTPERDDRGDDYLIGIAPAQDVVMKRFGPLKAVAAGAERTYDLIELTVVFVQKLFSGHVSTKNIGGPITVVQIAGQAAQTDVSSILTVLAFLSIQLGILNLLPIPILDGGHLFFNLFELVFRRPLSVRTREIAQQIGLVLLIMLMVVAFYNDIVRIFMG